MRTILLLFSLSVFQAGATAACRDCAGGAAGGPDDDPFVVFESPSAAGARQQGLPEVLVNTATLNLYISVVDLKLGGDAGLALERSFNLDGARPGPFGRGWTFRLGESLSRDPEGTWTLRRGSGRVDVFAPALEPGRFFAATRTTDILRQEADGTFRLSNPRSTVVRTFSAEGRLLSIDDGAFRRAALEYDGSGRLLRVRSLGRRLEFVYDENGRIAAVSDTAGRKVSYAYTADGNLAGYRTAGGEAVEWTYGEGGLPASITMPGGKFEFRYSEGAVAAVLVDGAATQYEAPGPRQVRSTGAAGTSTLYTYTASGSIESVTDGAGGRTTYAYDAAGRRTRITYPNGDSSRFDYDAAGNLAAITDAAGNRWTADYDGSGRPVRVVDANGNVWQLRYDAAGNLAAVTDPLRGETSALRDAAGLITSITGPNGSRRAFRYDADGLPAESTDPLGGIWKWRYDGAARPAARTDPGGAAVEADYDERGRMSAAQAGDSSTAFDAAIARDALNRITSHTDSFGNTVTYRYGAHGKLETLALPGGTVGYEYDKAGRLTKVSDWLGNFAVYRYDAAGAVASVTLSGGQATVYQYDAARNIRAVIGTGPDGAVVSAYRYTRDGNGNRTAATALDAVSGELRIAPSRMNYDAAGRVAARDDGQAFRYDEGGRLIAVEGPNPAGLAWDPFGRLQSFTAAGITTGYAYDGAGLLAARTRDGATRRYVYDLSGPYPRPAMETDAENKAVAWYVYGLGLLWKIDAAGRSYFYHFDGAGNVTAVSSATAGVVNRYRYDPLGRLESATEEIDNPFRTRGESGWLDGGNGLLYGRGELVWPEMRMALPASISLEPPARVLLPEWRGPAACFFEGPAPCEFAAGRSAR